MMTCECRPYSEVKKRPKGRIAPKGVRGPGAKDVRPRTHRAPAAPQRWVWTAAQAAGGSVERPKVPQRSHYEIAQRRKPPRPESTASGALPGCSGRVPSNEDALRGGCPQRRLPAKADARKGGCPQRRMEATPAASAKARAAGKTQQVPKGLLV